MSNMRVVALASTALGSAALAAPPLLCWSFVDDDAGYLYDPPYPYST